MMAKYTAQMGWPFMAIYIINELKGMLFNKHSRDGIAALFRNRRTNVVVEVILDHTSHHRPHFANCK